MTRALPLLLALALAPAAHATVPGVQSHRGGPVIGGVPTFAEETLPAFRSAARSFQTVLELDVKLTKDRVPVVIHDATLDRTTNCEGLVADRTLAQLAECKADVLGAPGNNLPTKPAPTPVPLATLAQVLALAKAEGSRINLEIKNYPTDDDYDPTPAFAERVMDEVLASGIPARQVIIQSFTPDNLDVAERRMKDAEISMLALAGFEDLAMSNAAARGWDWVSPSWPIDKSYVERAHAQNLKVVPYTINRADGIRAAAAAGVDAVITDDPLMALQALDTRAADVRLEPLTKKIGRVRRRGRLPVRVTTDEPATVALTARLGRRVAGRAKATFREKGSRRIVLRLNKRARKALRGRKKAKIALVARSRDLARNPGIARTAARLR